MTAPLPKTSTVFVVSEKGSRLSVPSTARAPLTVTGTSSATGCGRLAVAVSSKGDAGAAEDREAVSGGTVKTSFSLLVIAIGSSLGRKIFVRPRGKQGYP